MSDMTQHEITAAAWTEITVPADALNLTFKLTHSMGKAARIYIGDGGAPTDINDPALSQIECDTSQTYAIEDGDEVYARIYSTHGAKKGVLTLWAGDDVA